MSKTLALALFGLVILVARPAQGAVSAKAPETVLSGAYIVDPRRTQVGFTVEHLGFSSYSGRFSDATGNLDLNPRSKSKSKPAPGNAVHIAVPVASVSTANEMLDDALKGADWLDAKAFPLMVFASTSVTTDGTMAKVVGELTLHGVTRPVTFDVRFVGAGVDPLTKKYSAEFEISGDIKRSEFGVASFAPVVGDDVHLSIEAAFDKQ